MPSKRKTSTLLDEIRMLQSPSAWIAVSAFAAIVAFWARAVNSIVPEPYLDEVFHVRQAQKYIDGKYNEWDPKITTPPGLYLISTVLSWTTGFSSTASLRAINAILLPCLVLVLIDIGKNLMTVAEKPNSAQKSVASKDVNAISAFQIHTAVNVALFPPLFFFAALYYTDIAAVVSVLICWNHFLRIHATSAPSFIQDVVTILLGLISLTFRQTNIFWVSIFPAGILFISKVDDGLDDPNEDQETLLDPPVRESYLDDYMFFGLSLVQRCWLIFKTSLTGGYHPMTLIRLLYPYAIIILSFAAFVVSNGGVVLGDKSNHIATLHLPQMLYIWPYILFFSWPLCLAYLVQGAVSFLLTLTPLGWIEFNLMFSRKPLFPRIAVIVFFSTMAGVVIYYNTIVHPFTLADNRHYVFYVFRRLTRPAYMKYLVIPVYGTAAWAIIQTLGAPARLQVATPKDTTSGLEVKRTNPTDKPGPPPERPLHLNLAVDQEGAPVSFVCFWLVTSALQLVTAPLVEPRYFILSWIMWRLRVPRAGNPGTGRARLSIGSWKKLKLRLWTEHDGRLWLETAWFLLVNAVTGYVFLYHGFEWPQEKGKVQRFMW